MFVVVFNSEFGPVPYQWDDEVEGGLALSTSAGPFALFDSKADARLAIKISRMAAQLAELQKRSVNTDFTSDIDNVEVVPLARRT